MGLGMFCLSGSSSIRFFIAQSIKNDQSMTSRVGGFIRICGLVGYSAWCCQKMQKHGGIGLSSISGVFNGFNSLGGLRCFISI